MSNNSLPNFLIVGAMKSGTTSLYHYLNEHPQIFFPTIKEPRFFISSKLFKKEDLKIELLKHNSSAFIHTIDAYKDLFSNVKNEIAIGEASPYYLFNYQTTIPLILKYLGDIKIIIILRNPIYRAFSAYKHNRRYNPKSKEIVEKLSFIDALKAENSRIKTRKYPLMYFYKTAGLYFDQVKSYKDNFSNIFICKYDDLAKDPSTLMKNIFAFLEVDQNFKPNFEIRHNVAQSSTNVNLIHKIFLNLKYSTRMKILNNLGSIIGNHNVGRIINILVNKDQSKPNDESIKFLKNEFKEDILKLENLTNLDLQDWLK